MGFASLSIVTYTAWKFWILKDRWDKTGNFPDQQLLFGGELIYTLLMLYLLISADIAFLVIAFLSMFLHILFGIYVELFRPEIELDYEHKNIMSNYWRYILLDSTITFISFALITGVSYG